MNLEDSLKRIKFITQELEEQQLPLDEVIKLHEEGQTLIQQCEKLLSSAKERLKVTELSVDSDEHPEEDKQISESPDEISLF